MKNGKYRSRVSALFIPFWGILFIPFLHFVWPYSFIGLALILSIIIFFVFACRSTYYVVTDREILCYYLWGIYGKPFVRISISDITSIERSHNPWNGLALSLKRLRLRFNRGYKWNPPWPCLPLLSPVCEQEFLETLKSINPNIQINVNDKKGWWRFGDWDI